MILNTHPSDGQKKRVARRKRIKYYICVYIYGQFQPKLLARNILCLFKWITFYIAETFSRLCFFFYLSLCFLDEKTCTNKSARNWTRKQWNDSANMFRQCLIENDVFFNWTELVSSEFVQPTERAAANKIIIKYINK